MPSEELAPRRSRITLAELETLGHRDQRAAQWFWEMGFEPEHALLLTIAGAPPARVERALMDGCSLELAYEIWT